MSGFLFTPELGSNQLLSLIAKLSFSPLLTAKPEEIIKSTLCKGFFCSINYNNYLLFEIKKKTEVTFWGLIEKDKSPIISKFKSPDVTGAPKAGKQIPKFSVNTHFKTTIIYAEVTPLVMALH